MVLRGRCIILVVYVAKKGKAKHNELSLHLDVFEEEQRQKPERVGRSNKPKGRNKLEKKLINPMADF